MKNLSGIITAIIIIVFLGFLAMHNCDGLNSTCSAEDVNTEASATAEAGDQAAKECCDGADADCCQGEGHSHDHEKECCDGADPDCCEGEGHSHDHGEGHDQEHPRRGATRGCQAQNTRTRHPSARGRHGQPEGGRADGLYAGAGGYHPH